MRNNQVDTSTGQIECTRGSAFQPPATTRCLLDDTPVDILATCAEHHVVVSSSLIQRRNFNVLVHLEHVITTRTSLRTAFAQ
jgi:hypothetical protein